MPEPTGLSQSCPWQFRGKSGHRRTLRFLTESIREDIATQKKITASTHGGKGENVRQELTMSHSDARHVRDGG